MEAAFSILLFLCEPIGLTWLSGLRFITRLTEGIEGGFFHERSRGICHDTRGTQMVLMIVADAHSWIGYPHVDRDINFQINRLSGSNSMQWLRNKRQVAREPGEPLS